MAIETKVIKVHPNYEQTAINANQCFGWTCTGSQEVFSRDSHLEGVAGTVYSVTQTTNYVKLTFQRDPARIPNFAQLYELERQYYAVRDPQEKGYISVLKISLWTFAVICGLLTLLIFSWGQPEYLFFGAVTAGSIGGLVLLKRKKKERLQIIQENNKKRAAILSRTYPLRTGR